MKCEAWCFSVLHSCSWYPWRMCSCLWKEKGTKKNRRERNGTERKGREMNIREGKIRKQNRREENIREENRGQNKKKRCDCNGTRGAGWMWRGRKARANYFRVSFISFLLVFPCSKQHFQAEGSNLKTENIMLKYVKNCPPFLLRIRRDWQCLILIRHGMYITNTIASESNPYRILKLCCLQLHSEVWRNQGSVWTPEDIYNSKRCDIVKHLDVQNRHLESLKCHIVTSLSARRENSQLL